jgi:isopenicillin-N epimerase
VPLDADDETVVGAFTSQLTERTRLVVVDLITSPTARILPVAAVTAGVRAAPQCRSDAMVLVDSAHSPGHLPVDIAALGADAWMGNLHKWAFGARGTAVLWLAPQWRESVRPLVLGWQATDGFPHCFDARGTADLSAWMVIPDALALWKGLGGWAMAARNAELAAWGQRHVADAIGVSLDGLPATPAPAMRLIPLPPDIADTNDSAESLYGQLSTDAVEVGVIAWGGRGWLRPGSQVFTTEADHERLADVVASRLS